MDSGELLVVGLRVHNLVVVEHALENEHAIIPHPPMVVLIVLEGEFVGMFVIKKLVLVRKQSSFNNNVNYLLILVDGGWGSWTTWSSCSVTCGGGQRSRQRSCNNPAPSGGGSDCSGSSSQQEDCNSVNCPSETAM